MDYIEEFRVNLTYEKNYSPNTIASYISDITNFQKYLKNKSLTSVKSEDVHKYIKSLASMKDRSLARNLSSLRMFYMFLVKMNYMKDNPLYGITGPKIGKYLPDVLSIEEVDKLLDFEPKDNFTFRNRCILELLYSTGLRISELTSLKLSNINLDDCFVKVMGKGSKERIVPLSDIAVDYLREYIANVRPKMLKNRMCDDLFLNNHGLGLTRQAVFKMIKKRGEEVGLKKNISPHTLRHSFATHLLQNGADIRFIQELLGHSDVGTTEIYTHIANETLKESYDALNPRDH